MQLSRVEKKLNGFVTFLFILSIFVGVFHELTIEHDFDEKCEVCLIVHAPALLLDTPLIVSIELYFEEYLSPKIALFNQTKNSIRNRSPPLS
ncbi:MAG: hypothetical protein Q9M34_11465 [Sulfurimonas sp.]|nr:hypothetical protein [Sulfurimonas sp.]